jgi:hypothetical protein
MNHSVFHNKLIAFVFMFACTVVSSLSFAGSDFVAQMPAESKGKCTLSGNIMSCTGSFRAIRAQQADPGRWANVSITNSAAGLYMQYDGVFYSCAAPNTQAWRETFLAAISSSYFMVSYNVNTGVCTSLQVFDGSQYRNLSAL